MPKATSAPAAASEAAARTLIRRAGRHSLGRGFLLNGALDAVAATFGVHAFTVEKARELIAGQGGVTSRGRATMLRAHSQEPAGGTDEQEQP